ncbi:hypothetical protein DKX38_021731 [Salix brachista]|uniref:Suppressor of forked domain-containing protein n=1 Tax=Salix brachista TaxID=2182728 RepID=A0A5N5KAU0_9ROSI|nr:hypothetical protein DKX38_021731 [Salix brachista]
MRSQSLAYKGKGMPFLHKYCPHAYPLCIRLHYKCLAKGNLEDAFSLYEQAIAIEKGREHPLVLPALYDFLVYCFSLLVTIYAKCLMSWASILDIFFLCNDFLLLLFNADIKKLTESQEAPVTNILSLHLMQALIHLETFLPQPKQIDYLDSLVDNFILTRSDSVNPASASEREELSCIILEYKLWSMGDSETVVTEPPAVMNCTAAGYTSNGYADAISNIVPVPGVYIAEGAGNFTASFVAAQAAYTGNAYGTDSTYIVLVGHVEAAYGTEAVVGTDSTINNAAVTENASFVSPQAAGYDSAVDGNTSTEAGVVLSDENGNAGEVVGGGDAVQQFEDGSVPEMSAEEDRLWSIVKANSLAFDAWIALLDETEKVAGGMKYHTCDEFLDKILKIRKVYDAFLVEFPLCYGYWNKYADHEARLGFMDKVVEVYERAVLGVTYSVDIWLHYCIFAISMYEDPETIRR